MKINPNSKLGRVILTGVILFIFAKCLDLDMPDPVETFFCINDPGIKINNGSGVTVGSETLWCGTIGSSAYSTIYMRRWGLKKIILFYEGDFDATPDIKFPGGNTVSITVPGVDEIESKTNHWLGYAFDYHLDMRHHAHPDTPTKTTGTNKPSGDQ
jgi:hypothetical protein